MKRLVYVSSVHAIPEQEKLQVLEEVQNFSPEAVIGGYAKTKAEATQLVLEAVREGLDAVVVQPSGILGPYDSSHNHLVQMIADYLHGKLPACVRGGYDFVDVRDVADGCLAAAEKGKRGECYILSNRHYEVKDVLSMVRSSNGGRKLPYCPCGWPGPARRFWVGLQSTGKNVPFTPDIPSTLCRATTAFPMIRPPGSSATIPGIFALPLPIP